MESGAVLESLAGRIQTEYREMPRLTLTLRQASRLWNAPREVCEAALSSLVRSGFLSQGSDGSFLRRA